MARFLKEEKYSNGSLKFRETLSDDGKTTLFECCFSIILKEEKYSNGLLKSRETLSDDGKTTLKERWYPTKVNSLAADAQQLYGQQEDKGNYVNGQKHGLQELWYWNGKQQYKWNYVNGRKHGVQEGWYEDGQQKYKGNYVNGQQHGLQEYWYKDGQQLYKEYYLDKIQVSQEAYQSYIKGLAPEIQATIGFEEPNLSRIIAMYLLP